MDMDASCMPRLNCLEIYENQGKMKPSMVTAAKIDVIDTIASAATDAWELGCDIYKACKVIGKAIDIANNGTAYKAYASLLVSTFDHRESILTSSNIREVDSQKWIDASADEKEKLRTDLVMLLLCDEMILINQKNMRVISEKANWAYDGDRDVMTRERQYFISDKEYDEYLKEIRDIRNRINVIPDEYLILFNK